MVATSRTRLGITGGEIKVTQVRSGIGTKPKHRGTLRALGLGTIGDTNVLPDRPEIRGMIHRVPHLITVESVSEPIRTSTPEGGKKTTGAANTAAGTPTSAQSGEPR